MLTLQQLVTFSKLFLVLTKFRTMTTLSKDSAPIRAIFLPWMATGHIIPIVDFARLVAAHNIHCTIAVTPAKVSLIKDTVQNSCRYGLHMDILTFPFPAEESGHAGTCIVDMIKTHRPDVIVGDSHYADMSDIASELSIPYVIFHPVGMFPCCILGTLFSDRQHQSVSSDSEPFQVPGLPHKIELVRSELPDFLRSVTEFSVGNLKPKAKIFGAVVNSFRELEDEYAEFYEKGCGEKTWLVGPLSLAACSNKKDQAVRGGGDENYRKCMEWLDKRSAGSVVYLCFGSWCPFDKEQITELALGLERCGRNFMWVVREEKEELPEGFEERVKERGLVVRGWAPQVAVLGHAAVGGFVCHCGWNSLLEGVCAGVPMVTWPMLVEQFVTERLVTEVLRTGVRNWSGFRSTLLEEKVTVKAEDVAKAIGRIMDHSEEAEGMRRRAKEYGEKARMTVKEGGSSFNDLASFVAEIKACLNSA